MLAEPGKLLSKSSFRWFGHPGIIISDESFSLPTKVTLKVFAAINKRWKLFIAEEVVNRSMA
jgi:hypothetical protein